MSELKMYAALFGGLLWIASYVGLWWYRGNIDTKTCSATTEAMQLQAVKNQTDWTTVLTAVQEDNQQKEHNNEVALQDNQHKLDIAIAAAQRADSAHHELQQRLAQLGQQPGNQTGAASGGVQPPGTGLPVPAPDTSIGLGQVAHVANVLDADGLGASEDAAACAVKLTACEGWAAIVRSRVRGEPLPGDNSTVPGPSGSVPKRP